MYLCKVPSPLRLESVDGNMIKGRSGDTGLPDFMLWEHVNRQSSNSIRAIGDDLRFSCYPQQVPCLSKLYAIHNNILHEYTVGEIPEQDVVFPISLKRYTDSYTTILYLNCIDAFLRYTSLTKSVFTDGSFTLPSFLHRLMDRDPQLSKVLPPASIADQHLTLEMPYTITNLLNELGFECLNYSDSAAAYLIYNYGSDLAVLQDIFSIQAPDDIITLRGCAPQNNSPHYGGIEKSLLMKYVDAGSNEYYNSLAHNQLERTASVFGLRYLDKRSHWYVDLEIDEILESMLRLRNTDYNVQISDHMVVTPQRAMLSGFNPVDDASDCWDIIRQNIAMYNRKPIDGDPILNLSICKTWLDELFITIAKLSGCVENWYINLSLFHLYTPSIIRSRISS